MFNSLDFLKVKTMFETVFVDYNFILWKEEFEGGYHYHIILVFSSGGLMENTYNEQLKTLFPEFSEESFMVEILIDYEDKSKKFCSSLKMMDLLCGLSPISEYQKMTKDIFISNFPWEKISKYSNKKELMVIENMLEFSFYNTWLINYAAKNKEMPENTIKLWILSRLLIKRSDMLMSIPFQHNVNTLTLEKNFIMLAEKYNISLTDLSMLKHLATMLLIQSGAISASVPLKNIVISDNKRNQQIHLLLSKIEEAMKESIFLHLENKDLIMNKYPIFVWKNEAETENLYYPLMKILNHEPILLNTHSEANKLASPTGSIIFLSDKESQILIRYTSDLNWFYTYDFSADWSKFSSEEIHMLMSSVMQVNLMNYFIYSGVNSEYDRNLIQKGVTYQALGDNLYHMLEESMPFPMINMQIKESTFYSLAIKSFLPPEKIKPKKVADEKILKRLIKSAGPKKKGVP